MKDGEETKESGSLMAPLSRQIKPAPKSALLQKYADESLLFQLPRIKVSVNC